MSTGRHRFGAREILADPLLLPGALAFVVFVAWAVVAGGFAPTTWYPGAFFLVLLAAVALAAVPLARPPRLLVVALVSFAALTAWSFASIAWAEVKAPAWDGANRTLLYLVVFVMFALLPWRAASVAALLAAYSVAIGALGVFELFAAAGASDPSRYFPLGRFTAPSDYQNANCALFLSALAPAIFIAARRSSPAVLRALMLANCAVLLELALLTQSRASIVALPVTVLVFLVLGSDRARTLLVLAAAGVATGLAAGTLLEVFRAFEHKEGVEAALTAARDAVLISAAGLALLGAVAAAVDGRVVLPERFSRWGSRAVVGMAAGTAVAALLFLAASGNPIDRTRQAWHDFKATDRPVSRGSYFAKGVGGNRYDIWRVVVDRIRAHPLLGDGVDNFAVDYLRQRRTVEEPLFPHSLELRVLQQTGIIGGLLFAPFFALVLWRLARVRNLADPLTRNTAASAAAMFVYWLVHGSIDWFWELPALGGPAFAALGLALALTRGHQEPSRSQGAPAAAWAAAAVAVVIATITLAPPWLSAAEVDAAARGWKHDPAGSFARLDRARRLNPLSDNPDLVAGAIASRLHDWSTMQAAFQRALARNSSSWYGWLELGIAEAVQGNRREALRDLARARALDPGEPTIREVAADVAAGRRVRPARVDRILLERIDVH